MPVKPLAVGRLMREMKIVGDEDRQEAVRACGTCTLCCRLPEIETLSKPADAWCRHCTGHGCAIYTDRPQLCRDFLCLWRTDPALSDDWQPLRSHMLVYEQGPQVTILVDPDHPDVWRQEPYASALQDWAVSSEALGKYVILFCGDEVKKIEAVERGDDGGVTAPA